MLVLGLGDGFKNQETMKFVVFGLQNNEIGIWLYQSEADQFQEAFKPIIISPQFPHKWPQNCHNYSNMFSYGFPMIPRKRLKMPSASLFAVVWSGLGVGTGNPIRVWHFRDWIHLSLEKCTKEGPLGKHMENHGKIYWDNYSHVWDISWGNVVK